MLSLKNVSNECFSYHHRINILHYYIYDTQGNLSHHSKNEHSLNRFYSHLSYSILEPTYCYLQRVFSFL